MCDSARSSGEKIMRGMLIFSYFCFMNCYEYESVIFNLKTHQDLLIVNFLNEGVGQELSTDIATRADLAANTAYM
jgi:hypothetical protein